VQREVSNLVSFVTLALFIGTVTILVTVVH
jgi:hypothetical protein